MRPSELVWRFVLDPMVRRIDRRIRHFRKLEKTTHDGHAWRAVADISPGCLFYSDASLQNQGAPSDLVIGEHCHVRGEIVVLRPGRFSIGHHSFIGPGTRIWSRKGIAIGSHVLISHLVDIHDSDSHSTHWQDRRREGISLFEHRTARDSGDVASADVVIEDDAWIGFKSSILKGVRIGRGAVVAAGSVVTKDVPAFTLVAGNPATPKRELEP
jgi:acetyltransferase-like isoleucine patch superfamily enzyme